jgi:hypothetical protein
MTFLKMTTSVETHRRKCDVNQYDKTKAFGILLWHKSVMVLQNKMLSNIFVINKQEVRG